MLVSRLALGGVRVDLMHVDVQGNRLKPLEGDDRVAGDAGLLGELAQGGVNEVLVAPFDVSPGARNLPVALWRMWSTRSVSSRTMALQVT